MSERIIDSVKRCAKRAIEIQGLSFTELQTKMLETELILNNRPLCAIYDSDTKEVLNRIICSVFKQNVGSFLE